MAPAPTPKSRSREGAMRDRFNFDTAEKWFWRGFFLAAGITGFVFLMHTITGTISWVWGLLNG